MMNRIVSRWVAILLGLLLLACGLPARADTPLSVYQSFRGNYNFVGTEESLRLRDNNYPCSLVSNSTGIYATLKGIPSGAKIESAQLYWAGSGTTADYTVNFDGVSVTAPVARQYMSKYYTNNTTYTYFSGAADVTAQVAKKGNATYTFSGLTVSTGSPWCAVQGVVGGFALVVVYSSPTEVFRMLNLYEGFQAFRNTSLTINLSGFNVPNPLPSNATGRIGHITWEGDTTLSQDGEDLLFNGIQMYDGMNPKGNQFNSSSNVTGDTTSFGIDFDAYTVGTR
jgi:MSHA biogenesis protein MshQ